MRSSAMDNGIRTGVTFGVVIVTMFLIGFTVIGAELVGKIFGVPPSYSGAPSLLFFAIFMILVSMWCGASASKRPVSEPDTLKSALTAGLLRDLVSGLFAAVIGFIFGKLIENGIDPRTYLPSVSPDSVEMFLFNQSPLVGSLLLLVLITGVAVASAALSFTLRNNDWLKAKASKSSEIYPGKHSIRTCVKYSSIINMLVTDS